MSDETSQLDALLEQAREGGAGFDWSEATAEEASGEQVALLEFRVGAQRYAVLGEEVREVIGRAAVTRVPGAPDYIRGIVIHRRQVIGLLDLERWFEVGAAPPLEEQGRVIIIEHDALVVGLLAAPETRIVQWPVEALERSPSGDALPSRLRMYTRSLRDEAEGPVVLLDVARLLEDAAVRQ